MCTRKHLQLTLSYIGLVNEPRVQLATILRENINILYVQICVLAERDSSSVILNLPRSSLTNAAALGVATPQDFREGFEAYLLSLAG